MNCRPTLPALLLAAVPAFAQDTLPPLPANRGALLYDTHCVACHTTQMHWRDKRIATDWESLKAQVRRWQATAHLGWSEEDVDAVARHLDERIYRFGAPGRRAAAPHGGSEPDRGTRIGFGPHANAAPLVAGGDRSRGN
jgi:hypothetical protein